MAVLLTGRLVRMLLGPLGEALEQDRREAGSE